MWWYGACIHAYMMAFMASGQQDRSALFITKIWSISDGFIQAHWPANVPCPPSMPSSFTLAPRSACCAQSRIGRRRVITGSDKIYSAHCMHARRVLYSMLSPSVRSRPGAYPSAAKRLQFTSDMTRADRFPPLFLASQPGSVFCIHSVKGTDTYRPLRPTVMVIVRGQRR